ncbi:hypothetical protein N0V82_001237 [Gnomoniopsis sp. IMI 355080]|nr:hypothetical protein N0V82_001237 [Gnomoniopsis sp. IMI 355080]
MVAAGWAIVITVVIFVAVGAVGWLLYSRWRAQKLGLPPPAFTSFLPFRSKSDPYGGPAPRSGGIQGWFGDQVTKFKNRNNRTAAGAYEGAPISRGGNTGRGFGALDPDAAWDAHVGDEADYGGPAGYGDEEHELGLGPYGRNSTAYEGAHGGRGGPLGGSLGGQAESYSMNLAATPRMAPEGPEAEFDSRGRAGRNPFDDDAAEPSNLSLRGVSPRPMEGEHHGKGSGADSPTERRSVFTEQV